MGPTDIIVIGLRVAAALYLAGALAHTILQRHHARASARQPDAGPVGGYRPAVDVIVPCYDEDPALLERCCASLVTQDYQGRLRVFLVDDASRDSAAMAPLFRRYAAQPGWTVVLLDRHAGKRRAQDAVIAMGSGEVVVTVDSDTCVAPDGIRRIAAPFHDRSVGAVSGSVRILNASTNLLTRLIAQRYEVLFGLERAAQDRFDSVLVCAGAFSAYRRAAIADVWVDYLGQRFRGAPCLAGDDLHLTTLVLRRGDRVLLEPAARARTSAPSTLRRYIQQQLRWTRSFYRELPWLLPALRRRHPYVGFDVAARALLPLLLGAALPLWLAGAALASGDLAGHHLTLAAMLGSHAVLLLWQTHSVSYSLLYGILHVIGLLVPAKLRALLSVHDSGWVTRATPALPDADAPVPARALAAGSLGVTGSPDR